MKKTIKFLFACAAVVAIVALIVVSCNKTQKESTIQKPTVTKSRNVCYCDKKPTACGSFDKCWRNVMDKKDSREFIIFWKTFNGCTSMPANSTGRLCYTGNCGEFYLIIDNPPVCLSDCYDTPSCTTLNNCTCESKTNYSLYYNSSEINVSVTLAGDPKIKLECSHGTYRNCAGDLTWK
ncbi:MAG: hypothetical protein WC223_12255 [Bacteroidales bacterium]|jgi:hypothetical protein